MGYNDFAPRRETDDEDEPVREKPKVIEISHDTREALRDLETCATWADFVKLCDEQRVRRGW
jgi:hypothetical protein